MGDWEEVFGSNVSLDDLEDMGFFDDNEDDSAIYTTKNKLAQTINKMDFEEIYQRVENQSYNYSYRNSYGKKGTVSSILMDNNSNLYIPIFNYFDEYIKWIQIDFFSPIEINKNFSFSSKYSFLNKKEMLNIISKNKLGIINKRNIESCNFKLEVIKSEDKISNSAICIIDEQLYNKGIYFLIKFLQGKNKKYVRIQMEGVLSVRGNNILRTDEHGNNFYDKLEFQNRYKYIDIQKAIYL